MGLSPLDQEALALVGGHHILAMPHLVRLIGRHKRGVERTMQRLKDAGLVEVVYVPVLPGQGSFPNVYRLTAKAARRLDLSPPPAWKPQNQLFLQHTLLVRDVATYLACARRRHRLAGGRIVYEPRHLRPARPDAQIIISLPRATLQGFLEADTGTERGTKWWQAKVAGYRTLFALPPARLAEMTGYQGARVLIVVPDARRREALDRLVKQLDAPNYWRYWFAPCEILAGDDLTVPVWTNRGQSAALISAEHL